MATKSSPEKKAKHPKKPKPPKAPVPPVPPIPSGQPIFGQPTPSPDPTSFKNPVTDQKFRGINIPSAVPMPLIAAVEPVLTLAQVYGSAGAAKVAALEKAGQLVFHSVGDTGNVTGPQTQSLVADKMVSDFTEANAADVPSFFFHLGDVVYFFGESTFYYDQFFEPYRDYAAPILAIAGNHDGVVYAGDPATTLTGFVENFVTPAPVQSPDSGGLFRTTMIQPAVYYTFEAPFVRILALYSNVLEDPGVISSQTGTTQPNTVLDSRQVDFLAAALKRIKAEKFAGAIIIAVHHPPFTGGSTHGGSPLMLADIDSACTAAGIWPHAVLSGHSHNYQRFTRTFSNGEHAAYLVAGCGGHSPLSKMSSTLRTPFPIDSTLTLENYDATDFGYLRIIVSATALTIEFHPAADGATTKTPNDTVTIDLATHRVV
ncbi:hypothetical protein HDF16_002465 [Granulicella aggregans]|uniref:Calcineurin-like phosphoesterase domain-containing protein n=1 Tax=Granulicella aggregans TaxID=474949 RepID=A0A7W7ZD71_9BACT|nr:metallophosphoesterase [Granulicella aggregans]MBB5057759.1 hypothetical protein [Granulicella aggregans]